MGRFDHIIMDGLFHGDIGDMKEADKIPNPGRDAALAMGCTCPMLDNGHGNEELWKIRGFWINSDCPLHGDGSQGNE